MDSRSRGDADGAVRFAYRVAYRGLRAYWYLRRPREDSAHVAAWSGRQVLLVRNSYRDSIGFPAGWVRGGEDPAQAARREFQEEVGLDVAAEGVSPAGQFSTRVDYKLDLARIFEVEFDDPDPRVDGREVVWADWVDVEAAFDLDLYAIVRRYLEAYRDAGALSDRGRIRRR